MDLTMSRISTEVTAPSAAALFGANGLASVELPDSFLGPGVRLSDRQALTPSLDSGPQAPSRTKSALLILVVSSMIFIGSLLTGILTIGLPRIARDVELRENLLLWPASVYALTCGCTLLLSGSLADLFGSRIVYLIGASLLTAFTMGCGLAQTGIQLIVFRAFSGIALSLCLPSATSMITAAFPSGRGRNIAFACYGAAQPLGFSLGLVLAGALIQSIGWRACYYIVTGITFLSSTAAIWLLPPDNPRRDPLTVGHAVQSVDWIGAGMASTSLGLFSYVLAVVTASSSSIHSPVNIAMLSIATLLILAFVLWIGYRERHGRAAIIPPSLFKSTTSSPHRARIFTATCLSIFCIFGSFMALSYFSTLFYQEV